MFGTGYTMHNREEGVMDATWCDWCQDHTRRTAKGRCIPCANYKREQIALRREIIRLQTENERLRAEVEQLRAAITALGRSYAAYTALSGNG